MACLRRLTNPDVGFVEMEGRSAMGIDEPAEEAHRHVEPEVRSCGFVVFRREPQFSFLLMKHVDRWDLPKGHVDPGETDLECALRELEEETGIRDHSIQLIDDFRFVHRYHVRRNTARRDETGKLKELVIFLGVGDSLDRIELTEHPGYEWVTWDPPHAIQQQTIDPLLQHVADYLRERGGLL